ncbi:GATA-type zinc finger protein 1 isoform 1-T2 [Synchiropus picturatus]
MEQDPSKSSLFYLFQEVSNLQLPGHDNFLDSNLHSTWLNKSTTDSLTVPKIEVDIREGCCQQCPECVMPCQETAEIGSEDSYLGEQGSECSSPWKVLSLINLQCERLMHDRDGGEMCGKKFAKSAVKPRKTDQTVESTFEPHHLSGRTQNGGIQLLTEAQPEQVTSSDVANKSEMVCTVIENVPDATQMALPSMKKAAHMPDSAQTQDHNCNHVCMTERLLEFSLPPNTSSSSSNHTSELLVVTRSHKLSPEPKCSPLPTEESQWRPQEETFTPGFTKEENHLPPSSSNGSPKSSRRSKTQRKQSNPTRSVSLQDANVQGVAFTMDAHLDESKEHCRLLITSKYSEKLLRRARRTRRRTRRVITLKTSSSDEGSDMTNATRGGKVCASCCTKKTPMWRDADDGTPLCNACGIRYKKYRVRCGNCWHIPRKENNSNSCCLKCGTSVRSMGGSRRSEH